MSHLIQQYNHILIEYFEVYFIYLKRRASKRERERRREERERRVEAVSVSTALPLLVP